MSVRVGGLCLVLLLLAPVTLAAAPGPGRDQVASELDQLFARLRTTRDPVEAELVESRIADIWADAHSATATLLYHRALEAMATDDNDLAFDLLSAVTDLAPDFAEGWHELGAVNFDLGAHDAALIDLERTLSLEPRHYGALLGLASIFELYGNKKAALEALRRAYALNPHIEGLKGRIKALEREVEGQGI